MSSYKNENQTRKRIGRLFLSVFFFVLFFCVSGNSALAAETQGGFFSDKIWV
jgi:hypothetical protein